MIEPMPLRCNCVRTHVFVVSWIRSDGQSVDLSVYRTWQARDAAAQRLAGTQVRAERHNVHVDD